MQKTRKQKEIDQELGIKSCGTYKGNELQYILHEDKGNKVRVFMNSSPERIKNDKTEETREEYKYRRSMMKFSQTKRNRRFWDSTNMGTYKVQTVDQVEKKYKELKDSDKFEEKLMEMDKKLHEQKLIKQEENE